MKNTTRLHKHLKTVNKAVRLFDSIPVIINKKFPEINGIVHYNYLAHLPRRMEFSFWQKKATSVIPTMQIKLDLDRNLTFSGGDVNGLIPDFLSDLFQKNDELIENFYWALRSIEDSIHATLNGLDIIASINLYPQYLDDSERRGSPFLYLHCVFNTDNVSEKKPVEIFSLNLHSQVVSVNHKMSKAFASDDGYIRANRELSSTVLSLFKSL